MTGQGSTQPMQMGDLLEMLIALLFGTLKLSLYLALLNFRIGQVQESCER